VVEKSTSESKPQHPPLPGELRWQRFARTILAGFLAITAALAYERNYLESIHVLVALLAVCAGILGYNSLLPVSSRLNIPTSRLMLVALILDLFALTCFLHFSGDIENPLMFAYSLPVVAGAVLVSRRAAFLLAAGASLLFFVLMIFTTLDASPIALQHYHLNLVDNLDVTTYIDPDVNSQGWNYILAHLMGLVSILFGLALCARPKEMTPSHHPPVLGPPRPARPRATVPPRPPAPAKAAAPAAPVPAVARTLAPAAR
jgi:hypothetical protein